MWSRCFAMSNTSTICTGVYVSQNICFHVKKQKKKKTGIAAALEIKTGKNYLIITRGFFAHCSDDPTAVTHQSIIKKAAS